MDPRTQFDSSGVVRRERAFVDGEEHVFARLSPLVSDGERLPATAAELYAPEEALVVYGWLTAPAWNHAHENLRFELVRTQTTLVRRPGEGATSPPPEVRELPCFDEQSRWLFDRCSGGWGAAVVRDERYLNERFVDAPGRRYLRLGVRAEDGVLRGYAVLAFAPWSRIGDGRGFGPGGTPARATAVPATFVVDWLVPADEPEVGELLHEAVLAHARAHHAEAVLEVVPEWSRWFQRFQRWGWLVEPTERIVAVRSRMPHYDMHWLRDHWWYQWAEGHVL